MRGINKKSGILFLGITMLLVLVVLAACAAPAPSPAPKPAMPAAPPQAAGAKIVLTMAGTIPENDIKTKAVRQFIAEVLDKTKGEIQINHFPNGQLIADKDMVTAMPARMADLAQCQLGGFSGLIPETQILDMRFTFDSEDHWFAVGNGKIGEIIWKKLEDKAKCKFLGWLAQGPADSWAHTEKTIKQPEDLKGVKFRAPPSALLVKAITALGAQGTTVSVQELYTALQSGVVKGTFSTVGTLYENKWFEAAPYISKMDNAPNASHSIIVNLESWSRIPANYQQVMITAAKNAEKWTRSFSEQNNEEYWDKIKQLLKDGKIKDLYVIPDDVRAKWSAIVLPSQKQAITDNPNMTPGVLDVIEQARPKK